MKKLKAGARINICAVMFIAVLFENNQKVKATKMFIGVWIDKLNVAYTSNGILFRKGILTYAKIYMR